MKEDKITKDQVLKADKRIHTILEELEKMGKAADLINTANKRSKESVLTSSELVKINDDFVKDAIKEIKSLKEMLEKKIKTLVVDNSLTSEMLEREIKALVVDINKTKNAILKSNKNLYTTENSLKDQVLIQGLIDDNLKKVKKLFSANDTRIDVAFTQLINKVDSIDKKIASDNKVKFEALENSLNINKILSFIILVVVIAIGYLLITI